MERKTRGASGPCKSAVYWPAASLAPVCVVGTSRDFGCGENAPSISPASRTPTMARLVWWQGRGLGSVIGFIRYILMYVTRGACPRADDGKLSSGIKPTLSDVFIRPSDKPARRRTFDKDTANLFDHCRPVSRPRPRLDAPQACAIEAATNAGLAQW